MQQQPLDSENTAPEETALFQQHWKQMLRQKIAASIVVLLVFGIALICVFFLSFDKYYHPYFYFKYVGSGRELWKIPILPATFILAIFFVIMLLLFSIWTWAKTKSYPETPFLSALVAQVRYWKWASIGSVVALLLALGLGFYSFHLVNSDEDAAIEESKRESQERNK